MLSLMTELNLTKKSVINLCLHSSFVLGTLFVMSPVNAKSLSFLNIYTENYPPFNYKDKMGLPVGQSTLIVEKVMKAAGVEYKISFVPWARALKFAAENVNACVYSASRTPERERRYQWIGPLVENSWTVFGSAQEKGKVSKIQDLQNEKIGSYIGDAIVHFLREKKIQVIEANHDDVNVSLLKSGRIKYWATGKQNGQFLLDAANEKSIVALFDFHKTQMYLACSKRVDKTVIGKLNEAFKKVTTAP